MNTCPRCTRSYDDGVRFCSVDGAPVVATTDPSISRNVGRVLYGQFELRELAGRGATGTVWRAYQRTMDRIVAVKILHRELARDADIVRRFLREARAIAKIAHPNIVTVHMVGETEEGTPYLVMEHVDGISLETVVEAQGALSIGRVAHLGRQIASGLGEAHANGIIHRDLKPANLLVTDRARVADLIKILDFGIAKLVHPGDDATQITRGQQLFGTPHYMAPEQATGDPVDMRTDLYALGVVLFRLATGQVPFDAPAGMQVVLRHLRDAPPRPRDLNPLIPEALESLILACLAKKPEDRPKDADDVILALDQIAAADGVRGQWPPAPPPRATLPATPPPPPRPAEKEPEPVLSAALVTAPGVPSSAPMGAMLSGAHARPAARPRDRSIYVLIGFVLFLGGALYSLTHLSSSSDGLTGMSDLLPVSALPDLAQGFVQGPDRLAPDLSTPPDLASPPDLATPPKKRRRAADLPVTVFGPEGGTVTPERPVEPAPAPAPTP